MMGPPEDDLQYEFESATREFHGIIDLMVSVSDYIPATSENLNFFSPKFRSIINEASMLFDSIMTQHVHPRILKKPIRMSDINLHLDALSKIIKFDNIEIEFIVIGGPRIRTIPFEDVKKTGTEDGKGWAPPRWWSAYNKLKHQFFQQSEYATLENTIKSVGACYILINCTYCDPIMRGIRSGGLYPFINDIPMPMGVVQFSQPINGFFNWDELQELLKREE